MLKVKLQRTGRRHQPTYRIVVAEARSKRSGRVIDNLGVYLPQREPAEVTVDQDKYRHWRQRGAQPTQTIRHLMKDRQN